MLLLDYRLLLLGAVINLLSQPKRFIVEGTFVAAPLIINICLNLEYVGTGLKRDVVVDAMIVAGLATGKPKKKILSVTSNCIMI